MTDVELDAAWASKFGGSGPWANDEKKLDLSQISDQQKEDVGRVVAYYYPSADNVFAFYAGVLTVPNRAIMECILNTGEANE